VHDKRQAANQKASVRCDAIVAARRRQAASVRFDVMARGESHLKGRVVTARTRSHSDAGMNASRDLHRRRGAQ
jgi:hypothetical protein